MSFDYIYGYSLQGKICNTWVKYREYYQKSKQKKLSIIDIFINA